MLLALACAKLREMTLEQDRQSPTEVSPKLTRRQVIVLQGLIDGFKLADFDRLGIGRLLLTYDKDTIAAQFGIPSRIIGLSRGVIWGVKQGILDTTKIPEIIGEKRNNNLDQFLEYVVTQVPRRDFVFEVPIERKNFMTFESEICKRLQVANFYVAIAAKAKEMKDRGEL